MLSSSGGDVFFGVGRMHGATRATLRDAGGERFAPADGGISSPNGVLTMSVKDLGAQESGRALQWSGTGAGTLEFIGLTRDLSRQSNGDMALAITYAAEQAPTARRRFTCCWWTVRGACSGARPARSPKRRAPRWPRRRGDRHTAP